MQYHRQTVLLLDCGSQGRLLLLKSPDGYTHTAVLLFHMIAPGKNTETEQDGIQVMLQA
jgi:hypothetical protein